MPKIDFVANNNIDPSDKNLKHNVNELEEYRGYIVKHNVKIVLDYVVKGKVIVDPIFESIDFSLVVKNVMEIAVERKHLGRLIKLLADQQSTK